MILLMYCWIGPHSTPYGILHVPEAYIPSDLGWRRARLARAWAALEAADLVWRDGDLVFIVPFLMANPPANLNVVKGWKRAVSQLPESRFFKKLHDRAGNWLKPEGLAWLSDKIAGLCTLEPLEKTEADSEPFRNDLETVSKPFRNSGLRAQCAELRAQCAELRAQGGEAGSAATLASPPKAARFAAPGEAGNGDGQGEGVRALVSDLAGRKSMPVEIGTIDKSKIKAQKKIIGEMERKARGTGA